MGKGENLRGCFEEGVTMRKWSLMLFGWYFCNMSMYERIKTG